MRKRKLFYGAVCTLLFIAVLGIVLFSMSWKEKEFSKRNTLVKTEWEHKI